MTLSRAALWLLRMFAEVLVGTIGLAGAGACVLAWRAAQGPIDITALVRREQSLLPAQHTKIHVGAASLAWNGFRAPDQPLEFSTASLTVTLPAGTHLTLARGRLTMAVDQLLLGRFAPRDIDIAGADLELQRDADGRLDLGAGVAPANARTGHPFSLLRAINRPPRAIEDHPSELASCCSVSQLTRLQIHDSRAAVHDVRTGIDIRADGIAADLQRQPTGGVAGSARLDFAAATARATVTAAVELTSGGTHLSAQTTPLSPAALAPLDPHLAGAAAVDAPLSVALDARFGPDLAPLTAALDASLGAGQLRAGKGAIAIDSAKAHADLKPQSMTISSLRVDLAAPPGAHGAPPSLTGHADVTRAGSRLHAAFGLEVGALAFADLGQYWPDGTGGGGRRWLVANVPSGRAHDARVAGTLDSAADLSGLTLTTLSGDMLADDLTLYWLKPVPPIEQGRVHLVLESPDALHIDILGGKQGGLQLTGGSVRITGLSAEDQLSQIDADITGPLQDTLALLNHPRLGLLSRRPLEVTDPSGDMKAHLSIGLPLEDRVSLDQIVIKARANLTDVHLGHLALGRDLDRATLTLAVDDDGMTITGSGLFAAVPTDLTVDLDFRNGPPSQVLQHVTAEARPDAAQLKQSSLPADIVTGGRADVNVDYSSRRDHTDTVSIGADLTTAAVETPLGWTKASGIAASAGAVITLRDGKLAGLDHVHAEGPGLRIASHVEVAGGELQALVLDDVLVGRSAGHGRIGLPTKADKQLSITLQGSRLDLSAYLAKKPVKQPPALSAVKPAEPAPAKPGLPWSADFHFDHVDLAADHALAPVALTATNDGVRVTKARLDAGTPNSITASIEPGPDGRTLRIEALDAGTLLAAAGTFDNIRGGRLSLLATSPNSPSDAPVSGTATLSSFQITAAPAIGKLMQAMTLYGLADALRGPGLRFMRMVAPFTWRQGVLTLSDARAYSPSLGFTAKGSIDLRQHTADIAGTIVPAYFFNQLLGDIPVLGRVFSPEKGGGVFAARYSVRGPLADPKIGVNPFSALTPGFLRGVFGALR